MGNLKRLEIEITQTVVWYGALLLAKRHSKSTEKLDSLLEAVAARTGETERFDFASLSRYKNGKRSPSRLRGPESDGFLLRVAGAIWPSTRRWHDTPVWYLLKEQDISYERLVRCVRLLHPAIRDSFFWDPGSAQPSALAWKPITRSTIYGLVERRIEPRRFGPWSLGALACAMRESELRGEPGMVRWSAIGVVWVARELQSMVHPSMQDGLHQIRSFVDAYLIRMSKPGMLLGSAVTDMEIARFGKERLAYLDYFATGDFSVSDSIGYPPWLSD